MTDLLEESTCWLNGPITPDNYRQPPVACGSTVWSSATVDRRKVTCWNCALIIEMENYD